MLKRLKNISFSLGLVCLATSQGCGHDAQSGAPLSSNVSVSEVAGSMIAEIADSTERGGTLASMRASADVRACPRLADATCDGSKIVLAYNGCSFGDSSLRWQGQQVLTFEAGVCTTSPESSTVTFTRTFTPGTTNTDAQGVVVAIDTATPSGYASALSGGTTIIASSGNRTVAINGIHYVATKTTPSRSGGEKTTTLYDHTVSTPTDFTISGSGADRTISGGAIQVQHNQKKFIGTAAITQPLTFTEGCCHPTGGQITSTLSGSRTGSETLTYAASCGSATLTDLQGNTATIQLSACM